ncbi:MAG: cytochrome c oxidase assembly factor Coa1 family protein [Bacteroidota bacterium]
MEEYQQRKGWFARNWKWVVPSGGCLLIIILFIAFAGSLFVGISSMMTDSQAYKDSMEVVAANPQVIDALGEPIETNGMQGGNLSYKNGLNSAELTIPIKGPNGEATIYVAGSGTDDNWSYTLMEVHIDGTNEVINLLENTLPESELNDNGSF